MRPAELLCWCLVAVLGAGLLLRLRPPAASGFATMPILVPTSLTYESQLRDARGQPAGRGGAEAAELADRLLAMPLPDDPALAAEVEALADERARLLALRDRRHTLNVALMDVGVEVARQLRPDQWQDIVMHRDARRARAEVATFDRLLDRLRGRP